MMNDAMTMNGAAARAAKPVAERAREDGRKALSAVFNDESAFDKLAAAYIKATKGPR